ncbi:MAG: 1-hydroxycarotenoid 3,4-desaturase CrtD [Pseudomonadota bacterium]
MIRNDASTIVVGAGIAGLAAAIELAAAGREVTVCEVRDAPGGKMRTLTVDGHAIDSGPTVLTMRDVFESIFAAGGTTLDTEVTLAPLPVLARHAWDEGAHFDLLAEPQARDDEVARIFSPTARDELSAFLAHAKAVHNSLAHRFMRASQPSMLGLVGRFGLKGLPQLFANRPFASLWTELARHLSEPRLRQLFARYATYCGASPMRAPSTLMLIAHVEAAGVWHVVGGMQGLADALERTARRLGVTFRYGTRVANIEVEHERVCGITTDEGERLPAASLIFNADVSALADGLFGHGVAKAVKRVRPRDRALSAVTWSARGKSVGRPLAYHNVFFSRDYEREFDDIFSAGRTPDDPTVYLCAQEKTPDWEGHADTDADTSLFCLINAPPDGDTRSYTSDEDLERCTKTLHATATRCGLSLSLPSHSTQLTTPADFARMFPATGGALYGRATHGPFGAFQRPGSKTAVPGLYVAGGSAHPGPGIPMAALSGRLAASQLIADHASTRQFHPVATSGGTLTPSATTVSSD